MIPKTIHYCWFGGNPLPPAAKKCLDSWNKFLPNYKTVRWDESNFDINSNLYVKQAYEAKKYAFVSDYVRLFALYNYGGIYMDTDVEVLQRLDRFVDHKAFSGFESDTTIPTGIMACEKGFEGFRELLDYYKDKTFIKEDGTYDITTNVVIITEAYINKGLKQNDKLQTIEGFTLYPKQVFCPWPLPVGGKYGNEVYTVHHFAGSWLPEEERIRRNSWAYKTKLKTILTVRQVAINILGQECFDRIRGRK